jgi:hypothetical protein
MGEDEMKDSTTLLIEAVGEWWKGLRPSYWTEAQHLANPTVNTKTDNEKSIANCYAEALKEMK